MSSRFILRLVLAGWLMGAALSPRLWASTHEVPLFQLVQLKGSESCPFGLKTREGMSLCFSSFPWGLRGALVKCTGKQRMFAFGKAVPQVAPALKSLMHRLECAHTEVLGRSPLLTRALTQALDRWDALRWQTSLKLDRIDPRGVLSSLVVLKRPEDASFSDWLWMTGWVHVLTLAGVHLYGVFTLIGFVISRVGGGVGLSPEATRWCTRTAGGFAVAVLWALAGARWGAMRPLGLVLLARTFATDRSKLRAGTLLLALSLLEWFFSLALGDETEARMAGRMHYVAAVYGGALLAGSIRNANSHLRHLALAWGSWIGVAGIQVFLEGWISPWTPLWSLISLPFFVLWVYPLALTSLVLPEVFSGISNGALSLSMQVFESFVTNIEFPGLVWSVSRDAVVLSLLLAIWVPMRVRWPLGLGVVLFLRLGVFSIPSNEPPGAQSVEQLDVGQGDAALVYGMGTAIWMIDAGDSEALSWMNWLKLLSARQVSEIEALMLTHLDRDHFTGVFHLTRLTRLKRVAAARSVWGTERGIWLTEWLSRQGIETCELEDPSCFPFLAATVAGGKAGNALMSGVRVDLRSGGFYLNLGDADDKQELMLFGKLKHCGTRDRGWILKLSHHGSRYSSGSEFLRQLEACAPLSEVWVSAGLGNQHGHPTQEALARVRTQAPSALIHRTDVLGSIRGGAVRRRR